MDGPSFLVLFAGCLIAFDRCMSARHKGAEMF